MTAMQWIYGGFWLAFGAALAWYTVWASLFTLAYLYGFLKGIFGWR